MKTIIDERHYRELAALNPAVVCKRAGCDWDPGDRCYRLRVWGEDYAMFPNESRIEPLTDHGHPLHGYLALFMLHYLLGAQAVKPRGEWISEKDIPSGAAFFRGPHTIPGHLLTRRFGNDLPAFGQRCRRLQGRALEMADAAFCFQITRKVPVAVLYFEGDEDFPPEAKLLFDASISEHLALDVVFALAVAVCERIAA